MVVAGLVVVWYTSPQEETAPGTVAVASVESQDPAGTLHQVMRLVFAEPSATAVFALKAATFVRTVPAGAVIVEGQAVQMSAFGVAPSLAPLLSKYLSAAHEEILEHCAAAV